MYTKKYISQRYKITSEQNLDIFDIIKENEVVKSLERKDNKNKTVIGTNIFNNKKKISTQKKIFQKNI